MNKTISRFLLFNLVLPLSAAITEPVRVEQGLLSGVAGASPEVRVFKGVPFAGAPVADLRWRAPKPGPKWTSVRDASEFSAICMQRPGRPWEESDHQLAELMSSYWVNFATDLAMGFGDKVEVVPVPHKPALDFLDAYFEKQRKPPESRSHDQRRDR